MLGIGLSGSGAGGATRAKISIAADGASFQVTGFGRGLDPAGTYPMEWRRDGGAWTDMGDVTLGGASATVALSPAASQGEVIEARTKVAPAGRAVAPAAPLPGFSPTIFLATPDMPTKLPEGAAVYFRIDDESLAFNKQDDFPRYEFLALHEFYWDLGDQGDDTIAHKLPEGTRAARDMRYQRGPYVCARYRVPGVYTPTCRFYDLIAGAWREITGPTITIVDFWDYYSDVDPADKVYIIDTEAGYATPADFRAAAVAGEVQGLPAARAAEMAAANGDDAFLISHSTMHNGVFPDDAALLVPSGGTLRIPSSADCSFCHVRATDPKIGRWTLTASDTPIVYQSVTDMLRMVSEHDFQIVADVHFDSGWRANNPQEITSDSSTWEYGPDRNPVLFDNNADTTNVKFCLLDNAVIRGANRIFDGSARREIGDGPASRYIIDCEASDWLNGFNIGDRGAHVGNYIWQRDDAFDVPVQRNLNPGDNILGLEATSSPNMPGGTPGAKYYNVPFGPYARDNETFDGVVQNSHIVVFGNRNPNGRQPMFRMFDQLNALSRRMAIVGNHLEGWCVPITMTQVRSDYRDAVGGLIVDSNFLNLRRPAAVGSSEYASHGFILINRGFITIRNNVCKNPFSMFEMGLLCISKSVQPVDSNFVSMEQIGEIFVINNTVDWAAGVSQPPYLFVEDKAQDSDNLYIPRDHIHFFNNVVYDPNDTGSTDAALFLLDTNNGPASEAAYTAGGTRVTSLVDPATMEPDSGSTLVDSSSGARKALYDFAGTERVDPDKGAVERGGLISAYPLTYPDAPVSGAELWLDASDTTTQSGLPGLVQTWYDKSGNGRHFEQHGDGPARAPLEIDNAQNGLRMLHFEDPYRLRRLPNDIVTGAAPHTIFVVAKPQNITTQRQTAFSYGDDALASGTAFWHQYVDGSDNFGFRGGAVNENGFLAVGEAYSACFNLNTANVESLRIFFNGQRRRLTVASLSSTPLHIGADAFVLGERLDALQPGDFDLGEILVYTGTMTESQIRHTNQYLAKKWGLTWQY